ncbi:AcvB/VirJ family lysyl-phosphatidylglycerol hydrolase [Novosphingobium guangzhouense]|uniref:Type IV secretion system protein VirJ n=1 Tax=Novosphingobium guangzhouense TaxID=1850347 RepID=A0A2K2G6U2_9SPHN|nr:AcvB/VirJ family lysyl-phosphatidylglycerol hydrolase [Novosphingobium guangzhouense]PNU06757.1 type IV secretion system protein VirJ [Novosphingobium guangzhouense]
MTRLRTRFVLALLVVAVLGAGALAAPMLGLLGTRPVEMFPGSAPHPRVAAVFLSGDMGFRFGMGANVAAAIAAKGVPVVGVASPVVFAAHRTRADVDTVLAGAIRLAMARTGARRVILMGQSYGADILATSAPDLPPDLRRRVLAIDLTVPAHDVYFRADPAGLAYTGQPDARPLPAMRRINWAPIICVYGLAERDSLCPSLQGRARVIGLSGDHYLNHDAARLMATTIAALREAAPRAGLRP